MTRALRFIIEFFAILTIISSRDIFAANRAKYAGEFIAIGVGGRALGLGGAYVALAHDITAGYWNPAALSAIQYPQISLMHDERFGGLVNYDYGAIGIPVGAHSTIAFSALRLGVDNIPNTQNAGIDVNGDPLPPDQWQNFDHLDPSRITYFNSADWAFYISYARELSERFSYGVNLKIIRRDAGGSNAAGFGFDVAAKYMWIDNLFLGMNFQDITTTLVAWNNGTNELISPTLKFGAAYFINAFDGRFAPVFDIDARFENRRYASNAHLGDISFDFHSGLEFEFKKIAAIRLGYSDIGSLNFGAGVHLPKLDIDYSFAKFDGNEQLDNTHRISFTFTFESEQFKRNND